MTSKRNLLTLVAAGICVTGLGTAHAAVFHDRLVAENARPGTAQVAETTSQPRPRVDAVAQAGNTVYFGGQFDAVKDNSGVDDARNLAALDNTTGQLTTFAPRTDGRVRAIVADNGGIYVAGDFKTVNGTTRVGVARIDANTGAVDQAFNAKLRGRVYDMEIVRGWLVLAGNFPKRLVAVNPATGEATDYLNEVVAGEAFDEESGVESWGITTVYQFAVDPSQTHLVAVGNFATVDGQARERAFALDLGETSTSLSPWYYPSFAKRCATTNPRRVAYLQNVDFSPDGSYFVIVATGQIPYRVSEIGETVCDAAARFETGVPTPHRPTWINYTGGDSVWGVSVTGSAVYVQGHFRWLDNPYGRNDYAPPAVVRPGIGAIDPASGQAMAWDPRKPAKAGGSAFLATPDGLWVGSDSTHFNGDPHYGLAFVPLP